MLNDFQLCWVWRCLVHAPNESLPRRVVEEARRTGGTSQVFCFKPRTPKIGSKRGVQTVTGVVQVISLYGPICEGFVCFCLELVCGSMMLAIAKTGAGVQMGVLAFP